MPAKSKVQAGLMGADLARARAGKKTRTGMSQAQLKEYASTPRKGLPARKGPAKTHMMPGGKAMHGAHHPAPAKRKGR